jgi:hypothetical protein
MQVAGAEGHVLHGFDQRHDVVLGNVDVLDGPLKKIGLFRRILGGWVLAHGLSPKHKLLW